MTHSQLLFTQKNIFFVLNSPRGASIIVSQPDAFPFNIFSRSDEEEKTTKLVYVVFGEFIYIFFFPHPIGQLLTHRHTHTSVKQIHISNDKAIGGANHFVCGGLLATARWPTVVCSFHAHRRSVVGCWKIAPL
jgi:hypothetical protein